MKKSNFIKSHSIAKQHAQRQWRYVTLFFITVVLIIIMIMQARQLVTYVKAKQNYQRVQNKAKQCEPSFAQQQQLKKEIKTLQTKVAKIKSAKKNQKNIVTFLQKIKNIPSLEQIEIDNNAFKLTLHIEEPTQLTTLLTLLEKEDIIQDVSFDTMHQNEKGYRVSVKGTLT